LTFGKDTDKEKWEVFFARHSVHYYTMRTSQKPLRQDKHKDIGRLHFLT